MGGSLVGVGVWVGAGVNVMVADGEGASVFVGDGEGANVSDGDGVKIAAGVEVEETIEVNCAAGEAQAASKLVIKTIRKRRGKTGILGFGRRDFIFK